jgi:hypothetical protein
VSSAVSGDIAVTHERLLSNHGKGYGGGGGIFASGNLAIDQSQVSGNQASEDEGGGVDATGELSVDESVISGNHGGFGGGVFSTGSDVIDASTIAGNVADQKGDEYEYGTVGAAAGYSAKARSN